MSIPTATLRLVEILDRHSVYRDEHGDLVYLQHGTRRRLTPWQEIELLDEWDEFETDEVNTDERRSAFLLHLAEITVESHLPSLSWCFDCDEPVWSINQSYVAGDRTVCRDCYQDHYSSCVHCGVSYHDEDLRSDIYGSDVCTGCLNSYYTWCSDCDQYVSADSPCRHMSRCCESPKMSFTVRNDGEPPLANDVIATVALASGTISAEGIAEIYQLLCSAAYKIGVNSPDAFKDPQYLAMIDTANDLSKLGSDWQTRQGNYAKRLSRMAYNDHQVKLSQDVMSSVGVIAREHSAGSEYEVAFTRDLNLPAGDFWHEDSCWWGEFNHSRCALKTNGGMGMRTFDEHGYVSGRAWVLPMRRSILGHWKPTFDTVTPEAFAVFNGYGRLEGYTAARIMAHMAGWTYRKITLCIDTMYVNGESGYLVAPEDVAGPLTDGEISMSMNYHSDLIMRERLAEEQAEEQRETADV